jgi:putative transposase
MPWKVSDVMDERFRFVLAHESGLYTMTDLCRRFEISRETGYKYVRRYKEHGMEGLRDLSRAPHTCPHRMAPDLTLLLLETRDAHTTWGPKKLLRWLRRKHPARADELPAVSTYGDLLVREGRVKRRKPRSKPAYTPAAPLYTQAPNEVWTADFKGEFRLGNGQYCYPFTLADAHSRYLLACQAENSTALAGVRHAMVATFREHGLPQALRTDNGTPFVGHGLSGLTALSVWWIKLGIRHQRIQKGRPDQNGSHERMHRTLKAEATRPPEASLAPQQCRFDGFRREFNDERPHEALDQYTPSSIYRGSTRPYPESLLTPEYPAHYERRKIDGNGHFKFRGHRLFIAHPLAGESIGLVEIDEDLWSVQFYDHELGRITPVNGNFFIKVSAMLPV